jgi:hypothetical protein
MNRVKQYAKRVKQNAQFHSIDAGLEMFANEFEGYPDSGYADELGTSYCGAMKLAEALVGQDLMGFHPDSLFYASGVDSAGTSLYMTCSVAVPDPTRNVKARKGPYLDLDGANASSLSDLFGPGSVGSFPENLRIDNKAQLVLCDEYPRVANRSTGKRVGMPVLYYKADVSKIRHEVAGLATGENVYNSDDNQQLVDLGMPWQAGAAHPMASAGGTTPDGEASDPGIFYDITRDENVDVVPRPRKPDSYILMSAGYDGLYGTEDDVFNFEE